VERKGRDVVVISRKKRKLKGANELLRIYNNSCRSLSESKSLIRSHNSIGPTTEKENS
jgi:hypothetical protein